MLALSAAALAPLVRVQENRPVDRPTVSAEAQRQYELVVAQMAAVAGATPGKLMGMPTLYVAGKAFAGLFGDAMVFKLEGGAHAAALALTGAALFDPSGMGRPMKAWVQVPLEHASTWTGFAGSGARGVAAGG
jgi:hypothetical protein